MLLLREGKAVDAYEGGEIGGKKSEVKVWVTKGGFCERAAERFFVWTTPKHAMMKHRDRRMELGQDPSIIAASDGVR